MDISAVLTELERREMEEAADAVGDATSEDEAAAATASVQAAPAAGETAAEDAHAKGTRPDKKKGKKPKAPKPVAAAGGADVDLATAPTQPQSPSPGGDDGGDGASAAASSAASKKKTKKNKKPQDDTEEQSEPQRESRRNRGAAPPDDEDLDELASKARKAKKAAKDGGSAAEGAALNTLAGAASSAGGSSAGGQGEEEDPRWKAVLKVDVTKEKPGHKNRANQKHASQVWDNYSPTGVKLDEEFCKETFDHSDGKAWARVPYNPKVHKAPRKLRDGEWYPTNKDRLRAYENTSRTMFFVPRLGPADKCNVVHTDPNERLFPTQHKYVPGTFHGTMLPGIGVVWFTEDDNKSKSRYKDWVGSIEELETPEHGVHEYFSDIVPGYYAKVDSSDTKKYAVLYVCRPFKSYDLEPEVMVREIDDKENFVAGATQKSIKCENIIEVGGGNNSLCKRVVQWLKGMGPMFHACTHASAT